MLVLATVILLLLVAKDLSLTSAYNMLAELGAGRHETAPPVDPEKPVADVLEPGGGGGGDPVLGEPGRGTGGAPGGDEERDTPEQMPTRSPDSNPPKPESAKSRAPTPAQPRSTSEPEEQAPTPSPKSARDDARQEPPQSPPPEVDEGRVVGFDPCWRRHAEGDRQYYFAYDITFESEPEPGGYRIEPHRDWRAGVPIIEEALATDLNVLKDFPKGVTTARELKAFGRRVELALAGKRDERPDDGYIDNCLLAVTLDRNAPGWVAEFIRMEVGFYPITRDAQLR